MASWMEKDVLIECMSSVLGPTSWTHATDDPDRIALLQQQGRLYRMSPEEIDYKKEMAFIKSKKAALEKSAPVD